MTNRAITGDYYSDEDSFTEDEIIHQIEINAKMAQVDARGYVERMTRVFHGLQEIATSNDLTEKRFNQIVKGITRDLSAAIDLQERQHQVATEAGIVVRRLRGQRDMTIREYEKLLRAIENVDMADPRVQQFIVELKGLEDWGEAAAQFIEDAKNNLIFDIQVVINNLRRSLDPIHAGKLLELITGEREATPYQQELIAQLIESFGEWDAR